MAWTQYQAGGKPKKQSTSPLYTYSGATGASGNVRRVENTTEPTPPVAQTPPPVTQAPAAPIPGYMPWSEDPRNIKQRDKNTLLDFIGTRQYDVTPYGASPRNTVVMEGLTHVWNPRSNRYEVSGVAPATGNQGAGAQTALTPEQLAQVGNAMLSADASARAAQLQAEEAIKTADIDYFANLRGARQGATTSANDWRALLAGAGLSRSPAIGLMQLERIRGGLTGREIGLEAERRADQAAARQKAREAAAGAAEIKANLGAQIGMYESGNAQKYLDELIKNYLPTSG